MQLVFVDDSKQLSPTRNGMGPLVAVGAVMVEADVARSAERALGALCEASGFPADEEFKWSPARDHWMHSSLVDEDRQEFFLRVIDVLAMHGAVAHLALEDISKARATGADVSPEDDVIALLLERLALRLRQAATTGFLVADRPGGGRRDEDRFIGDCLRALNTGTKYVQHDELSFVLTTDSKFVRLLQSADLVTSCMTAYIAGEVRYAPPVAKAMLKLFPTGWGGRGGTSIKLHPDFRYVNL